MKRTATRLLICLTLMLAGAISWHAGAQNSDKPIVLAHTYQETFSDADTWGYPGGGDFSRVGYGVYFGDEFLKPFIGAKVVKVRFYLPFTPKKDAKLCVYRTEYPLYDMKPIPEAIAQGEMTMKKGWNEFVLLSPVEITKGEVISATLLGLEGAGNFAVQDPTLPNSPESTMFYQPNSMAGPESWNPAFRMLGLPVGPIPIQLYITGKNLDPSSIQDKAHLQLIATNGYYKAGAKSIPINIRVSNAGSTPVKNLTIAYSYDRGPEQLLNVPITLAVSGSDKMKMATIDLNPPSDLARHLVNVHIAKVNDKEIAKATPLSRQVQMYNAQNTFPRNTLIEVGVSADHFYSPAVNDGMRMAMAEAGDKANCIEYHFTQNVPGNDAYVIPNAKGGWLDRYKIAYTYLTIDRELMTPYMQASADGSSVYGYLFGMSADGATVGKYIKSHVLGYTKNFPGFARIEIANKGKETGKYKFEVSGQISKDAPKGKMKLVLLMTEDGLWQNPQSFANGTNGGYSYDFTARMYVTDPAGTNLEVDKDGKFVYTSPEVNLKLSGTKLRAVAFIVPDQEDVFASPVLNSSSLVLATGVGVLKPEVDNLAIYATKGRIVVEGIYNNCSVFDINGRQVQCTDLPAGVYVVKVVAKDGELVIRKLIVQ